VGNYLIKHDRIRALRSGNGAKRPPHPLRGLIGSERASAKAIWFALLLVACVWNQAAADSITVHPAHIGANEPFLILLDEEYSSVCGTDFVVRISPRSIDLVTRQLPGPPCPPTVGPPQKRLFSPRDMVEPGYEFGPFIEIAHVYERLDGSSSVVAFELLSFAEGEDPSSQVQTGSWIRDGLPNSGLFVDQQGEVLSMALLDYAQDGSPLWLYSAGTVHGDAYIGDLVSYADTGCGYVDCGRAVPTQAGRIYAVLDDSNSLVVGIDHASLPDSVQLLGPWDQTTVSNRAFEYRRLELNRHPSLASGEAFLGFRVPDLVGSWVGGVTGDAEHAPYLQPFRVSYAGRDLDPPLERHSFRVFGTTPQSIGGRLDPDAVLFNIVCSDAQLEGGTVSCFLQGYRYPGGSCGSAFRFSAVGPARVSAQATCADRNGSYGTTFEMFKVD